MRKKLSDAITEIGEQGGLDTVNITAHKERVKRYINAIREVIQEQPYTFQATKIRTQIRLNASVTAGTVQASANGYEVTGSSAVFTTNLVKPYNSYVLILDGRQYQIEDVQDADTLTLSVPFGGTATAAGQSYRIYKKWYPLDYNINRIYHIKEQSQPRELFYVDPKDTQYYYIDDTPGAQAFPEVYTLYGEQESAVVQEYEDLGGNSGDYTATAVASADFFGDGVRPGTLFQVSSTAFTVERVLTKNKVRFEKLIASAIGSHGSATARNDGRRMISFYPTPDKDDTLSLLAEKKLTELRSDDDYIEDGWWPAIRAGAIMRVYEYLKRPLGEKRDMFNVALRQLIRDQVVKDGTYTRLKQHFPNRYSGLF